MNLRDLQAHAVSLRMHARYISTSGEYVVNFLPVDGGTPATSRYFSNAHEAFEAMSDMAAQRDVCDHDWQEQPGEPPRDACPKCGAWRS